MKINLEELMKSVAVIDGDLWRTWLYRDLSVRRAYWSVDQLRKKHKLLEKKLLDALHAAMLEYAIGKQAQLPDLRDESGEDRESYVRWMVKEIHELEVIAANNVVSRAERDRVKVNARMREYRKREKEKRSAKPDAGPGFVSEKL